MKLLFLIVIGVTIVSSAEIRNDAREDWEQGISGFKEECIAETGVNPDLVHKMEYKYDFVKNEALECYYHCLYRNAEVYDHNGRFSGEKYTKKIQTVPLALSTRCASETVGVEECGKAYQMVKCVIIGLMV